MKKIRIYLDYRCYPLWEYDENGELIDTHLVDELKNEKLIEKMLDEIQETYNSLFIDDKVCFEYKGFLNNEEREEFLDKVSKVVELIELKVGDKYLIVNDSSI